MNTKKNILVISTMYILYVVILVLVSASCDGRGWCDIREDSIFGIVLFSLTALLPLFFLSLITYRMKDEVFQAWWSFARWWVPIIILVTLFFEGVGSEGGIGIGGAVQGAFVFLILAILYAVLIAVSLFRIIRSYLKTRKG